jgi:murein DD-endopeptidase MepM/ murein hydrolase activator NlpD
MRGASIGGRLPRFAARALVPLLVAAGEISSWGCGARGPTILSSYRSRLGANQRQRFADHAGVDFSAPRGAPVLAAAPGEVLHVGLDPEGCGIGVLIAHWEHDRFTVYCHLERATVREGAQVRRGEAIGQVGTTGDAVAVPHVHLELCKNRCARGHRDGSLRNTEDPLRRIVGCFSPGRKYPEDRLVLTHPIACAD